MLLVVPSDPLAPRKPDAHFADEHAAAKELDLAVALVDHDALVAGDCAAAVRSVPPDDDIVYRGWMLSAGEYAGFAGAVSARGGRLRTGATSYRAGHELPGWLDAVRGFTAETAWTTSDSPDEFDELCARFGSGPAVLRDFVKSEKRSWEEAAFLPDVADRAAARKVAARFRELRDDVFTGGFVLRRFERYVSEEVRTWWVDGRGALVTAHPDTATDTPEGYVEPDGFAEAVAALGLPFVSADFARRDDGVWRLIEIGDGQVSDRPRSTPPADLVAALDRRAGGGGRPAG